jgi:hypothetical protein
MTCLRLDPWWFLFYANRQLQPIVAALANMRLGSVSLLYFFALCSLHSDPRLLPSPEVSYRFDYIRCHLSRKASTIDGVSSISKMFRNWLLDWVR